MFGNAAFMFRFSNFYSSFKPNFSRTFCSGFKLFEHHTVRLWRDCSICLCMYTHNILGSFSSLYLRVHNSSFVCDIFKRTHTYRHTHTHTYIYIYIDTIFLQPQFIMLWWSPQRDNKILLHGSISHKLNSNILSVDSILLCLFYLFPSSSFPPYCICILS